MKISFKQFFLLMTFVANICCSLLLVISNLSIFLDPFKWWPIAFAGIAFPLILSCSVLFLMFWLYIKPKKAFISLAAIILSSINIFSTFGFNIPSTFNLKKEKNTIRVITWNVGLMNYTAKDSTTGSINNLKIFKKLKETDADVVCLQEFFTGILKGQYGNLIDSIAKTLHYPYHYFSNDLTMFSGSFASGSIIFSKYNIVDSQKIIYSKPFPGSVIKAGIVILNDTIDIVTTRLQSLQFQSNEYKELNNIEKGSDTGFNGTKNIIQKIRLGYKQRVEQVKLVKELLDKSNRPLIFTGDLNDVPVSYTYYNIKNNLHDCWVKKGSGLGRTFIYISPTLRIDQIFFNDRFSIKQTERIFAEQASDHNAVVADFVLK